MAQGGWSKLVACSHTEVKVLLLTSPRSLSSSVPPIALSLMFCAFVSGSTAPAIRAVRAGRETSTTNSRSHADILGTAPSTCARKHGQG